MSSPPTLDLIGQVVLGRYRILRQLAHGGMGAVFLGRTEGAEGFAKPVVIKRVLPWLNADREVAQMFVREARILSNLQHPNIVPVLDFGQQDDGAYLMVLEYVHGYQLAEWHSFVAKARGNIPFEYAIHILAKVLEALHYAHTFKRADGKAMQIVHRDVTPTNVLLSDQGMVKLLDFGIARASGERSTSNGPAQLKGKLPYLPLEAFSGADPSVSSDVYSAGVMLYELLTGINPFNGLQAVDVYLKVLQVTAQPVRELRDDVPAGLDAVLERAMHRDAGIRYATAAEFAQALRSLRQRSDDEVGSALAHQLHEDFAGDMPAQLELEPLAVRELAWRGSSLHSTSIAAAAIDTRVKPQPDVRDPTGTKTTVSATIPPAVAKAAARTSRPQPAPHATSGISLSRAMVAAGLAGLCGAIAALLAWITFAPKAPVEERMVVIARESTVQPDAGAARAVTQPADTEPAPTAETTPAAAPAQADNTPADTKPLDPSLTAIVRAPGSGRTTPDAAALTRAFERRQGSVQTCFVKHATGMESPPQLSIHFRVGTTGKVDSASLSPAELTDLPLGQCLLAVAKKTQFGALPRSVSFHIPISAEKVASHN